jgi:glycerophosphoryl diester phosphodiesterase
MSRRSLRLAHRGDWRAAPENSLAAVAASVHVPGIDGIEFDVRASADGVPVLVHDETLARVHGRSERVDALSVRELGELGVATLEDVLIVAPSSMFLDVELKGDPGVEAVVAVIERARGRGTPPNTAISSFDVEPLVAVRRIRPTWSRWLNAEDLSPSTIATAVELGCEVIAAEWRAIDESSLERARATGVEVAAWTIREAGQLARVESLGVVAVCVEGSVMDALGMSPRRSLAEGL